MSNKGCCFLVSFSPFEDNGRICVIGTKAKGKDVEIINALDDQKKVQAIYDILTNKDYVWPDDLK
nr:MAG TPA: hypothetical protein [Caudoviricetes sp.]